MLEFLQQSGLFEKSILLALLIEMGHMHNLDRNGAWQNGVLCPVDGAKGPAGKPGGDAIIPNLLPDVAISFCHTWNLIT